MNKVTIFGDIMVEPPFMQQVKKDGKYNFKPSFAPLSSLLKESSYVIGNLETPLAGEEAGYTDRIVSFNSPDCLLDALENLCFDAVTTANNHCVDRGYEGLVRTLKILDLYGIAHTGTYPEGYEGDRIHYFEAGETKFALISYTFATNHDVNGVYFEGSKSKCVNMLRPMRNGSPLYKPMPQNYFDTKEYITELLGRPMIWEETIKLQKAMHLPVPVIDDLVNEQEQDDFFRQVEEDYHEARKHADLVIFCPHVGGQFNETPGLYTQRLLKKCADLGFDGVFAAHSHTSQKAEYLGNTICFYSMGNVSMSPGTFYSVPECLPQYGLVAHIYVDFGELIKVTFSIIKMVEDGDCPMRIVPVHDLYKELDDAGKAALMADVKKVFTRVTGRELKGDELSAEYAII